MRYLETINITDGVPQNLELHYRRIEQAICKRHPLELHCTLDGRVKCRIVYDIYSVLDVTYSRYTLPSITSLKIIECPTIDYHKKYEDRTAIAELYSQRETADEILITRDGMVTDTSFCNVVFENAEGLFTPDTYLLDGTKRRYLLTQGTIKERTIRAVDIEKYDRIHLINAMIDLGEVIVKKIQ